MDGFMEDDYAPATRSMLPSIVGLVALLLIVAALIWRRRRA